MTTYQKSVARLQPIIPVLFEGLQVGLTAAVEEHDRQQFRRDVDPHYFSHQVRRHACEWLKTRGLLAVIGDDERTSRLMSSMQLEYRGAYLWVFRSTNGVPLPDSAKKERFYRQEGTLYGGDNLILLWNDDDGQLLDTMELVRPLGGDRRRHTLRLDWVGPLRLAMATMRARDLDELRPTQEYKQLGGGDSA